MAYYNEFIFQETSDEYIDIMLILKSYLQFCGNILLRRSNYSKLSSPLSAKYKNLDYSRFPVLKEDDIDEQFVRGSGPGGQAVNKTSNCVVLRHIPTNLVVKCHIHRVVTENQKEARKILLTKLDNLLNGDTSIEAQKRAIETKKNAEKSRRQSKLREMKKRFKEELSSNKDDNI